MDYLEEKYRKLGIENAPGQEKMQKKAKLDIRGEKIAGEPVDFSHGDVDAFHPLPGSLERFIEGYHIGGKQAYTEYRGKGEIREDVAKKLSAFTGAKINPQQEIILTPGTQGALFLAVGAMVGKNDKVAIVEPDYFANRKLVEFFDAQIVPIHMDYEKYENKAGIRLDELKQAFEDGVKLFLFSNPNNPAGVIYSYNEICTIAALAKKYQASLIVDELYSRQIFDNRKYTHLCAQKEIPENLITIIGPSKTESLSGFRLGAAFGSSTLIARMEKLQAIVSLRAAGYCQAVYQTWFQEPPHFMEERILAHQQIRDDIIKRIRQEKGFFVRKTEAGSYLFIELPELEVEIVDFVKIVRQLADVTITPGTEFGPQFTHHFRINFSQDRDKAIHAVDRVIQVANRYRRQ